MKKYILLISRLTGYLIDYIPFLFILFYLDKYGILGYIISLVFLFLYRYISTSIWGATFGMAQLKIKLNKFDFKICLRREIFRFASAFFYLGYIYAIFDPKGRTLHDIAADTMVKYKGSKEENIKSYKLVVIIAYVLLFISVLRWSVSFVLNDFGLIGLKKLYTSEEYFQSFAGDNLISMSQQELYQKTLGRKYTAVVDIGNKPHLIRISNKLKYTEVYKLNLFDHGMNGEYIYRINMPIQYLCSGKFKSKIDFCGVSPNNEIIIADEKGKIYGMSKVNLINIITLKCGDVDRDGQDESIILDKNGDIEVFKYTSKGLTPVFIGKVGEDIIPETFFIDNGIEIVSKGYEKSILYSYEFVNGKFVFKDMKYFKEREISNIGEYDSNIMVSNISRNNMAFKVGSIQALEMYRVNGKIKRIYNFGDRPGRSYAYTVKSFEGIYDIDGDGQDEIILKSVGREDVMGEGYKIEIYSIDKHTIWINRILSFLEEILKPKLA